MFIQLGRHSSDIALTGFDKDLPTSDDYNCNICMCVCMYVCV